MPRAEARPVTEAVTRKLTLLEPPLMGCWAAGGQSVVAYASTVVTAVTAAPPRAAMLGTSLAAEQVEQLKRAGT